MLETAIETVFGVDASSISVSKKIFKKQKILKQNNKIKIITNNNY